MADTMSDSPLSVASGLGRDRLASPTSHRRNNRNRKPRQPSAVQSDGVVSESALNPAASPRSKKSQKPRQNLAAGIIPAQQTPGKSPTMKQRPISVGQYGAESPLKEQAYAGPTFQSSPAASALPMPKFFSKSVPSGIGKPSLQGRLAGERSPELSASSPESDTVQPSVPSRDTQQSPLDVFFNADRAEREKMRNASYGNSPKLTNHTLQTQADDTRLGFSSRPRNDVLIPAPVEGQSKPQHHASKSPGPRPLSEGTTTSPSIKVPSGSSDEERQAYTQSLKDLLFRTAAPQASTPPRGQNDLTFESQTPDSANLTPSPFQRASSGPSTPQNATEQQTNQSFHYGNRNLSPLFKAARSETPARPSSLRQQMSCDGESTTDSAVDVNSPPPTAIHHSPQYRHHQPPYQPSTQSDWRSFPPGYAAYQPRHPPPNTTPYSHSHSPVASKGVWNNPEPPVSPRTSGPDDIKTMEDDLRRILKLNVLS